MIIRKTLAIITIKASLSMIGIAIGFLIFFHQSPPEQHALQPQQRSTLPSRANSFGVACWARYIYDSDDMEIVTCANTRNIGYSSSNDCSNILLGNYRFILQDTSWADFTAFITSFQQQSHDATFADLKDHFNIEFSERDPSCAPDSLAVL